MKSSSSNLQVLAFLILVFIFALFCLGTKAVFAVRRRLRKRSSPSASDSSTHVSPPSQAQTQTRTQAHSYDQYITPTSPDCDTERGKVPGYVTSSSVSVVVFEANDHNDSKKPSLSPIVAFMGWRHRVLYESDSIPELALLPSYRPRESVSRKVLNFVLRKKRVRPDPPTIASVRQAIEAAELKALARRGAKTDSSPAHELSIPTIVVHCACAKEHLTVLGPEANIPCSCSCASAASTSTSTTTSTSTSTSIPSLSFWLSTLEFASGPTIAPTFQRQVPNSEPVITAHLPSPSPSFSDTASCPVRVSTSTAEDCPPSLLSLTGTRAQDHAEEKLDIIAHIQTHLSNAYSSSSVSGKLSPALVTFARPPAPTAPPSPPRTTPNGSTHNIIIPQRPGSPTIAARRTSASGGFSDSFPLLATAPAPASGLDAGAREEEREGGRAGVAPSPVSRSLSRTAEDSSETSTTVTATTWTRTPLPHCQAALLRIHARAINAVSAALRNGDGVPLGSSQSQSLSLSQSPPCLSPASRQSQHKHAHAHAHAHEDCQCTATHGLAPPPVRGLGLLPLRLSPTFSTTSSIVDLLLEAIAADTDSSESDSSGSSEEGGGGGGYDSASTSTASVDSSLADWKPSPDANAGAGACSRGGFSGGSGSEGEDEDEDGEDILSDVLKSYFEVR